MSKSIIDRINEDRIQAMRDADAIKKNVLTYVKGLIDRVGLDDGKRQTTDDEALAIIKKQVKDLRETAKRSLEIGNTGKAELTDSEVAVLEAYLPEQMDEDAIRSAIIEIVGSSDITDKKTKGKAMGGLKKAYNGLYDGKTAASIFDDLVSDATKVDEADDESKED